MAVGTRNAMQVDFRVGHVQDDIFSRGGGFISSESIVLAAKARNTSDGAEVDESNDLEKFIAIGLAENVTVAQQKNLQQLFEIGSRESYFIPGRTIVQAALNRVIFDGDSLLRVLYPTETPGTTGGTDGAHMVDFDSTLFETTSSPPGVSDGSATSAAGDMWFNLASEFFNKPFTLALLLYNDAAILKGYIVLERCYVEAHNMNVIAAQTVVTENVRLRASKLSSFTATTSQSETA